MILFLWSCDLVGSCDRYTCYPGPPNVYIELVPNLPADSSYLDVGAWGITDNNRPIAIRLAEDTTWNDLAPTMNLALTDSSLVLFGNGITYYHLDDLNTEVLLNYGNGDIDTIQVQLGESLSECCREHYLQSASFNGVTMAIDARFYYKTTLPGQ